MCLEDSCGRGDKCPRCSVESLFFQPLLIFRMGRFDNDAGLSIQNSKGLRAMRRNATAVLSIPVLSEMGI